MKTHYVYIMSNIHRTLYVGMTNNLERRVYEHKMGFVEGFTKRYTIHSLVYYDVTNEVEGAIFREKQIKAWRRSKKIELIESMNPRWKDLSAEWLGTDSSLHSE